MTALKSIASLVGAIGVILVIKQLSLPVWLTIILVGGVLFGLMYVIATLMAGSAKNNQDGEDRPSMDQKKSM